MSTNKKIAAVRTLVPAIVGVFIARIIAGFPAVATTIAWLDELIVDIAAAGGVPLVGVTATYLIQAALTALVIWAWYAAARTLGDRWPSVEKWMLGSDARPSYEPRYRAN